MTTTPPTLPGDLADLRAMSVALLDAEMDPITLARESVRIAYTAVAVAFTQGVITQEVAQGLINALDAVLAEIEAV